jgi:hypothetical protein
MIFPQGSELQLQPSSERSEYGKLALAAAGNFVGTPEFAQQYCIQPGDTIFVLGILSWEPCRKTPGRRATRLPQAVSCLRSGQDLSGKAKPIGCGAKLIPSWTRHFLSGVADVVAKLNLKSFLYKWGGPAAALWGLWEILQRTGFLQWPIQN